MGETREETRGEAFERLLGIVDHLREPDGCPWDREQTVESMAPHLIEEAHELLEAVECGADADVVEEAGDVVDAPIAKDPRSPIRMKMGVLEEGLSAQTRFVRKAVMGELSLVECHPLSGRTHQIRVHLEHIGHPILGDKIYGQDPEVFLSIWEKRPLEDLAQRLGHPRHCLHAAEIAFDLEEGERRFSAPLAEDMRVLIEGAQL